MPPADRAREEFSRAVENYSDFMYNVAYRVLGDPEEAADAVQDAFLSAFRNWKGFRGEAEVSTWLYRITVNACLMRLRKRRRSPTVALPEGLEQPATHWSEDPERAALNAELQRRLEEALASLPPDLRVAVVLRDVQGLSNAEAARALGITLSAFKARLHRGRLLMRERLEPFLRA